MTFMVSAKLEKAVTKKWLSKQQNTTPKVIAHMDTHTHTPQLQTKKLTNTLMTSIQTHRVERKGFIRKLIS